MQQAYRKAHRQIWRIMPLLLLIVFAGSLAMRQNRLAAFQPERIDSPAAARGTPR